MFTEEQENRIDKIFSHIKPGAKIEKGHVIEAFQYNSNFKVAKDGKFIKEKLKVQQDSISNELTEYQSKLNSVLSQLRDIRPTGEPSSYLFCDMRKEAFDWYPKMFSYEQKEPYYPQKNYDTIYPQMESLSSANSTPQKSTVDLMSEYNEAAREYIRHKADSLFIDVLMNTISDTQKIELNGSMLKLLV